MSRRERKVGSKSTVSRAMGTVSPALMVHYRAELAATRARLSAALPPLQAAWGEFLRPHPWAWFVTLTFADPVHPEQANKRFRRWIAALERHPDRCAHGPIVWARGDERQRRQVVHFHALLAGVEKIQIFAAINLWRRIGGGWARIEPYDPSRGGEFYIAKSGDVELSATWFETTTPVTKNIDSMRS